MRKFICSFGLVCTVAAAAFLGGCNKNADKCCEGGDKAACQEKAAPVKTDAQTPPAATPGCCKDKAAGCSGEKKTCPSTGASN